MSNNKPYIFFGEADSPIGPLTIVSTSKGVCKIEFGGIDETITNIQVWVKKHFLKSEMVREDEQIKFIAGQLDDYFNGIRFSFDVPLDLHGTPFQKKVWDALGRIPHGETRSYKEVAESMNAVKAVRAIGNANNKNPLPILIPCHRVIGSNGSLVGYGGGLKRKQYLLDIEKVHSKIS